MTPARRAAFGPREPYFTLPDWVPPSGGLRTWECGEHFDALRIPAQSAPPLIAALQAAGGRGPVLADPYSGSGHILLDPDSGTSERWTLNGMRPAAARDPSHRAGRHRHRGPGPALAHPTRPG
ncbi:MULTISPECIES: hypothetical protein [Streptomyces]|uniref:DNA methylase n=1 Tax=Streptomyces griseiscabiei TaxID=2993540 RepID=A0ABU4LEP2_9ACTN|nr:MULTISPECIES: hypothetical protein [Streptomyces]MDX2913945.1 hypothetical protein [Streptomyces griseiscabiei]